VPKEAKRKRDHVPCSPLNITEQTKLQNIWNRKEKWKVRSTVDEKREEVMDKVK
jgi:hypothetical protein